MTLNRRQAPRSQHDGAPSSSGATRQTQAGSRRHFFTQLAQTGAKLAAGYSLLQAALGRSQAAQPTSVRSEPPIESEINAADVTRLRANLAQSAGTVGTVTIYHYGAKGEPIRQMDASGAWGRCSRFPDETAGTDEQPCPVDPNFIESNSQWGIDIHGNLVYHHISG
jgi:hypothetical protein